MKNNMWGDYAHPGKDILNELGVVTAIAVVVSILLGILLLARGCEVRTAAAGEIDLDQWADAIHLAEGNENYGILSIPCVKGAQCRQYCKNTVYNTLVKYRNSRCNAGESDIDCLSRRYCPIKGKGFTNAEKRLNIHWKKNVLYFLNQENINVKYKK